MISVPYRPDSRHAMVQVIYILYKKLFVEMFGKMPIPRFVGSLKLSKGCSEVFCTAWKMHLRKLLTYLLSQSEQLR